MGVDAMETRAKLREKKVALRGVKERVEALLKQREYSKVVEEIEDFSRGYTPVERDIEWAELRVRLAFAKEELGRYDKETAVSAYNVLKPTGKHREIGTVEWILGRMHLALGETKVALRYLRNSLSQFDRMEDERRKLQVLNTLGRACFLSSRTEEAIEHLTEALKLCREEVNRGNKSQEAMVLGNLGTVYRRVGQWPLASKMLRESLSLYEEMNDNLEIVRGLIGLARLLIMQRNFAEAEDLLKRAETLGQDYPRELAMTFESLGDLAVERGQLQKAKEYYQRTLEIGRKVAPQGDLINQVQRRRVELLILEGQDLEGASKCCEEALKVSQTLGDRLEEGCCYRTMGRLFQARNNSKSAQVNFEKAVNLLRSIEDRFELANTLLAEGEFSGRVDLLREARRLFAQIQNADYYVGLAKLQMARAEPSPRSASGHLREAENIFRARDETERLEEVGTLKAELNQRLSSSQAHRYQVLQGISSDDLGRIFERLIKEVEADRGFVAYARDGMGKMGIEARHNLTEEETKRLLSLLTEGNSFEVGKPSILYDTALDDRFSSVGAYSLMVTTFGDGKRVDGLLYLDRQKGKEPFLDKEYDLFYLLSERVTKAIYQKRQKELEKKVASLQRQLKLSGEIVTQDSRILETLDEVERIKDAGYPVLIEGETGTGKELIARLIHSSGCRKGKPFKAINCANIPGNLLESELFGHERGAFTDARTQHKGLFELADGGTVFLDEIGNLSPILQPKLLRFLEDQTFRRVGGTEEIKVDVRVIAATNKDLAQATQEGSFRDDLYYRIEGATLWLPPLRKRKDDIPLLFDHFMELYGERYGKKVRGITPQALELMMEYDWPGNVRQLKRAIELAVSHIEGEEGEITLELIRRGSPWKENQVLSQGVVSLPEKMALMEKEECLRALEKSNWKITKAANILRVPRTTLQNKMRKLGIAKGPETT